ncbi:Fic family protein, partial [Xanthomonas hortorum pv. gardneri]|nr:Fic family protein [Xanthomonas hortorum pv. gardneri]
MLDAIAAESGGAGIEALQAVFPQVARRTLQRQIADLANKGRLIVEGNARARKYRTIAQRGLEQLPTAQADTEIAITAEAAQVRNLIRRALPRRTPVGYQRQFLENYQPNQTAYLSSSLRAHLHQLGRSPVEGRPAGTYARQVLDRLLIDLSWASSRLEGNTYSRLDTQNLIQFGLAAAGKDHLEAQMILNHKAAIEMLVEQAQEIGFNRYTLQNL